MKLIKEKTSIDFLGRTSRTIAGGVAFLMLVVSLISLTTRGLQFGLDFTGGILLEITYPQAVDLDQLRGLMADAGYEEAQVQRYGADTAVLVRVPPQEDADLDAFRDAITATLTADEPDAKVLRVELVGSQVGEDLREQGGTAVIFALCMIFIYVMFRFQWKFAVGAIVATAHDVLVVLGFFSIFGWQFDLTVLAAVLAVIGYSLNDTVVVFDRVRENFLKLRGTDTEEVMNISINETLSRTLMTGMTTLMVLFALYFIAGETLEPFSLALIIGVLVGTYSSIYVASATAMWLNINANDLVPAEKEIQLIDDLP
ncbi:MAG TPA: protein translocase subunit SecF [Woeseiaceae bacterium]|nr:protein translocase subunit SecF [Woeseiaceae bacterium]